MSKLEAIPHHGFWAPMDTLKERSMLEDLYRSGKRPWALWTHEARPQVGQVLDKRFSVADAADDGDGPMAVAI